MDCPRCKLTLTDSDYEGQAVKFCNECWGYWVSRPQLEAIISSVTYSFSKAEAKASTSSKAGGDANRQGSEAKRLACPDCHAHMERKKYRPNLPVEIDECPAHGVWLDTGEIKDLQVFIERGLGN